MSWLLVGLLAALIAGFFLGRLVRPMAAPPPNEQDGKTIENLKTKDGFKVALFASEREFPELDYVKRATIVTP